MCFRNWISSFKLFTIVKDIILCNWHILRQNTLYLYLDKSKKVQDDHYKWLNWRHEDYSRTAQEKCNLQVSIPPRQKLDLSRFINARHMSQSIELRELHNVFFWNPSLLLQKKEFLLHFLCTFGFYNQAKSLAPTLKILFVFLCEVAVINYNNQWVVVELVTYLDLCKGASRVLGSAHQIG